ncbi:MAG: protein kinase [Bryobacteraceae bacterium]|nr:protein kinase [Bryobacteraceae bacterium]
MSNQAHWQEISELFDEALRQPATERSAWIARACSGKPPTLAEELTQLIAAHEMRGVLDTSPEIEAPTAFTTIPLSAGSKRVGPYTVLQELGRGGMGVVYKAHDERLGRNVALKFLNRDMARDSRARDFFLMEARAASALEHPNICTVYDVGESGGALYIAMAYCDGETLAERLKRGPLEVEECLAIALAIAEGLGRAHESGIVHRDIKPSNVVITQRGEVKILDFGVAQLDRPGTMLLQGRVGTIAYAAPEQLRGEEVDARADVWSLGVVLYEMATGRLPYTFDLREGILGRLQPKEEEPVPAGELRPELPPFVEALIARALAKRREDRFENGLAFAEALRGRQAQAGRVNLPLAPTSFVGRSEELQRGRALLRSVRLLTLTGPAGTGKTRLSLELARRMAAEFRDGAQFVALAGAHDRQQVLAALAEALEVYPREAATAANIQATLEGREMLLVLDNFEQVVSAASVVSEILTAAPQVKIIVTSRVALRLGAEHEMVVPPLPVDAAAVRLFMDRARAAAPDFGEDEATRGAVEEICRRLDGLPLAIELAAARVKYLTPQAIVARLGSRLDLLAGGSRDRPPRHQTLRQALAWSYDLLTDEERRVFRCSGIFSSGFSLDALEFVCGGTGTALDAVFTLVDHSLVVRRDGPDGEPRFGLLETMREYAVELLVRSGEEEQVRRAHADWVTNLAEAAGEALTGEQQGVWLRRLDADHDTVRAALTWLTGEGETAQALRIATGVWRYWTARGYHKEGRAWLERLLKAAWEDVDAGLRADAFNGCGTLAHESGEFAAAKDLLERALSLYRKSGNAHGVGLALNNLAWVLIEVGELDEALYLAEEAYRTHAQVGNIRGQAVALNNLAYVACYTARFEAARALSRRGIALRRQIGDARGVAYGLTNLALAEHLTGAYEESLAHADEAIAILDELRDEVLRAWAVQQRAAVHYETGQFDQAVAEITPAVPVWKRIGNSSGLAFGSYYLALALLQLGKATEASQVVDDCRRELGAEPPAWGSAALLLAEAQVLEANGSHKAGLLACRNAIESFQRLRDGRALACANEVLAELLPAEGADEARAALETAKRLRVEVGVAPSPLERRRVDRVRARLDEGGSRR